MYEMWIGCEGGKLANFEHGQEGPPLAGDI